MMADAEMKPEIEKVEREIEKVQREIEAKEK